MFINLEKGKLKLYDLQVSEGINNITRKIIINSPYDEKHIETTPPQRYREGLVEGDIMIKDLKVEPTGRYVEYNHYPFDAPIFSYRFKEYKLPPLYFLIERLRKKDYSVLELLNQYIIGNINNENQEMFNKYKNEILQNIKLFNLLDEQVDQTLYLYELLLNKGDEKLKTKLLDLKKYLDIYEMDIGKVPILIR